MIKNGLGSDWGSRKYKHLSPSARRALRKRVDPKNKEKPTACLESDILAACNRLRLFEGIGKLKELLMDFQSGTHMLVDPRVGELLVQKAIMAHRLANEVFEDAGKA